MFGDRNAGFAESLEKVKQVKTGLEKKLQNTPTLMKLPLTLSPLTWSMHFTLQAGHHLVRCPFVEMLCQRRNHSTHCVAPQALMFRSTTRMLCSSHHFCVLRSHHQLERFCKHSHDKCISSWSTGCGTFLSVIVTVISAPCLAVSVAWHW